MVFVMTFVVTTFCGIGSEERQRNKQKTNVGHVCVLDTVNPVLC